MCPDHLAPVIERKAWTPPPVFQWLQSAGNVTEDEMHRTFNMGIGMVFAVAPEDADTVCAALQTAGEAPVILGRLASA